MKPSKAKRLHLDGVADEVDARGVSVEVVGGKDVLEDGRLLPLGPLSAPLLQLPLQHLLLRVLLVLFVVVLFLFAQRRIVFAFERELRLFHLDLDGNEGGKK